MKIERLLLGLFASFLMVGCSQNDDLPNGGEEAKGKDSYVTVKIKSTANVSRVATDGGFENGTEAENEVKSAHFFFFKGDGSIFNISAPDVENYKGVATGNWLFFSQFADGTEQGGDGSVEEILDATLVFKGEEGDEIPASIVAVLNLDNDKLTSYASSGITLSNLQKQILITENESSATSFVMSNSVYSDGTVAVLSKNLGIGDVASTADLAQQHPVEIYVERLAVRVGVNIDDENNTTKTFDTNTVIDLVDGSTTSQQKVYAKILSWDINTTIDKSYLLKSIDPTWTDQALGFNWNDINNSRSYWAETSSITNASYDTSFDFSHFNDLEEKDYCLENTGSKNTKVIVRAQLVDGNGLALEIAQWYADYYKFDDLKGVVASHLNSQLYYSNDGTTWKSLASIADGETSPAGLSYIELVAGDGDGVNENTDHYQVSFDLSAAGKAVQWASNSDGSVDLTTEEVAAKLKSLIPAKVWTDGAAYYFTDIEHLGNKFGVVRNHAYEVSIIGVKGLGTPVYSVDENDFPEIPDPVIPGTLESYISAKINVLSWKIVNNSVTLGQ